MLRDYDTGKPIPPQHGVLEGQRPEDYVAGGFSFVSWEERQKDGNWRPYLPPGERQYSTKVDFMACVTFSALNSIETQEKKLTGKQPNYSDRWIAKMSGTTHEGNYLYKVADTIRKYGLVLEESYPTDPNSDWPEYYAEIPEAKMQELLAEGQEWLKTHAVDYEWITVSKESFIHHLKHAPIQITVPGHAIEHFFFEEQDVVNYFDTYNPFEKKTVVPNVKSALKLVLSEKTMVKRYIVNDSGKLGVMVSEGYTATTTYCDDFKDWPTFMKLFKVDETTPTVSLPPINLPE